MDRIIQMGMAGEPGIGRIRVFVVQDTHPHDRIPEACVKPGTYIREPDAVDPINLEPKPCKPGEKIGGKTFGDPTTGERCPTPEDDRIATNQEAGMSDLAAKAPIQLTKFQRIMCELLHGVPGFDKRCAGSCSRAMQRALMGEIKGRGQDDPDQIFEGVFMLLSSDPWFGGVDRLDKRRFIFRLVGEILRDVNIVRDFSLPTTAPRAKVGPKQPTRPFEDDAERECWQHAACLSIAEGAPEWNKPTVCDSVAMKAVRDLRHKAEASSEALDLAMGSLKKLCGIEQQLQACQKRCDILEQHNRRLSLFRNNVSSMASQLQEKLKEAMQ